MAKAILMSIQPQYVAKILNSEKTIEVRKKFPKDYVGWVYIYCTKNQGYNGETQLVRNIKTKEYSLWGDLESYNANDIRSGYNGKVLARFWCDKVEEINSYKHWNSDCDYDIHFETETLYYDKLLEKSCLNNQQLEDYLEFNGYAIHISKLEVFDKPKELKEFYKIGAWKVFEEQFDSSYLKREQQEIMEELEQTITKAPQSYMFVEGEND